MVHMNGSPARPKDMAMRHLAPKPDRLSGGWRNVVWGGTGCFYPSSVVHWSEVITQEQKRQERTGSSVQKDSPSCRVFAPEDVNCHTCDGTL